ncbi:MAG: HAD family hydrolase, partial [Actinomycetota bacterium]
MNGAVVFDLFHTLVDTEHLRPPGFRTIDAVGAAIGADAGAFAAFWASAYHERETSMRELADLVADYCKQAGLEFTASAWREVDALFGVCRDDALRRPDPAIVKLVAALATQTSVAVLSNCDVREVREWRASPLAEHIAVFGRSCEIGVMKPDVRSYRWVLQRLGIEAPDATFVGNGITGLRISRRVASGGGVTAGCRGISRRGSEQVGS